MQVIVKGVDDTIAKIRKEFKDLVEKENSKSANITMNALIAATPVDTGEARRGWRLSMTEKGYRFVNQVPYIQSLNNGHSKQAPVRFIEKVLLSHGKANGAIVMNTPD